ncbi:MAG: DMT family transporter [Promethearchaeota archaeon]
MTQIEIFIKMTVVFYWLGVFLAILAGSTTQSGSVLQKKVVNEVSEEAKFMKSLVKQPLWILGVILSFGVSSIFYLTAQLFIGPALIPGLMAFGLIVLALGSVKIVGEKLKTEEIIGIILMILGTFFLGVSGLSIDITETNLLELGFIIRTIVFTIIIVFLSLICHIFQKRVEKFKGILLAVLSGFMFALSNFWVSPLMGVITDIFSGTFNLAQIAIFITSIIILILTNVIGLATIQLAYRVGQASNMVPIQNVPTLITPIFIYFLIFLLAPPSIFSVIYLITGIILIGTSSFLLGKRSAQMEEIK